MGTFLTMVEKGEVAKVEIQDTYIAFTPKKNENKLFIKQDVWKIAVWLIVCMVQMLRFHK